ncbi:MAG: hypothetical protein CMP98_14305 [Gammaproteobacteria bacterium]|nr:hypothetical protein [Gammaproteobacteria bacterium]OUU06558.1 MAG: hypothetical protein CBB94_15095 [Gammaproteobacteria bacterium TMED34]
MRANCVAHGAKNQIEHIELNQAFLRGQQHLGDGHCDGGEDAEAACTVSIHDNVQRMPNNAEKNEIAVLTSVVLARN